MEEVIVRIVDMPAGVRGLTLPDIDGVFDVYINGKLSPEDQRKTFEHELEHIRKGDWQRLDCMSVAEIEQEIGA